MSRILPYPILSVALVIMWLLLTRFSLGNLVLGSIISVPAAWAFARIDPQAPTVRAWGPLFRLFWIVSVDIVRSNWAVARLLVSKGRNGARKSAFVDIPLRLRNPVPLALLAMVLTATPGTAWLEYDPETGVLLLHVFDMIDEEEWRVLIRDRYEALLLEAFA